MVMLRSKSTGPTKDKSELTSTMDSSCSSSSRNHNLIDHTSNNDDKKDNSHSSSLSNGKKPCAYSAVMKPKRNSSSTARESFSTNFVPSTSSSSSSSRSNSYSPKQSCRRQLSLEQFQRQQEQLVLSEKVTFDQPCMEKTNNKLLKHILNRHWVDAMDRLKRKPSDLKDCHLFLHLALDLRAPPALIMALGKGRPCAFYHFDATHGMMPLHIASQRGYSLEVIQYIYQEYPQAVREQCKSSQRLPLHYACLSNACRISVITFLLGEHPDSMDVPDSKGRVALDYILVNQHPHQTKIRREFEREKACWNAQELFATHNKNNDSDLGSANPVSYYICRRQWDLALARLERYPEEATIWTKYKNIRYLPIHYACKFKAPSNLIAELLDIHPFSCALTCQDFDMLPLHLACQYNLSITVIRALLEVYSDAATQQDDLGLLPLHLACSAGASVQVVKALVLAHPRACMRRDAKGFTPRVYAEAASHPHSKQVLHLLLMAAQQQEEKKEQEEEKY